MLLRFFFQGPNHSTLTHVRLDTLSAVERDAIIWHKVVATKTRGVLPVWPVWLGDFRAHMPTIRLDTLLLWWCHLAHALVLQAKDLG